MAGRERYFSLLQKKARTNLTPMEEDELRRLGTVVGLAEEEFKSTSIQNLGKTLGSGRLGICGRG